MPTEAEAVTTTDLFEIRPIIQPRAAVAQVEFPKPTDSETTEQERSLR